MRKQRKWKEKLERKNREREKEKMEREVREKKVTVKKKVDNWMREKIPLKTIDE